MPRNAGNIRIACSSSRADEREDSLPQNIETLPILLHPSVGYFRTLLLNIPMHLAVKYLRDNVPKEEMIAEQELLASYFHKPETGTIRKFISSLGTKLEHV